jgi:hypothetical protein
MDALLKGCIDLHIHAGPDIIPRCMDALEVARAASEAGMRAILLKDPNTMTADRAYIVNSICPQIGVYGGVVLNNAVGSLNPRAVETAIKYGAKMVWMPTIDAKYGFEMAKKIEWMSLLFKPNKTKPKLIKITDGGRLLPEVEEILNLIAEANVALASGHISPEERIVLIDEAKKLGVKKIILTHANLSLTYIPIEEQKGIVKKGVYFEFCYTACLPLFDRQDPTEIVKMIRAVGAEHVVMATDLGQIFNPNPIEGMRAYVHTLLKKGVKEEEIEVMAKKNPAKILNLE